MISKKVSIILFQIIWIVILLILFLIYKSNELNINLSIKIISIFFVFNFIFSIFLWFSLTQSLFDPYTLFIYAANSFLGGQIFLEVFGLNEFGFLGGQFPKNIVFITIFYITIGLAIFHLGGLLGLKENNKKENQIIFNQKYILAVGLFLLAISLYPTLIGLKSSLTKVMNFGYFGLFTGPKSTGFGAINHRLSLFFIPAIIFILVGGKNKKYLVNLSLILILTLTFINFFIGDRSGAVMPLIAYMWVWHKIIKPIPGYLLLSLGGIVLFIIFPLVSLTRDLSGAYRLNLEFLKEAFLTIKNPAIAIISEMGRSAITVAYTIMLVPAITPFQIGKSYFYGFFTIVPNFFANIHPSQAYGTPSNWLVWSVNPFFAKEGGGYGFTFIAESYLNFGWIGGLIILLILGFLTVKLYNYTKDKNKLGKIAFVGAFMAFYLKYARADINSVIRPLVWYALIPYLLIYLFYAIYKYNNNYFLNYLKIKFKFR